MFEAFRNPSLYKKFWVAALAAVGVIVFVCAPDAATGEAAFVVTRTEWYQVFVSVAGAIGVERVTNR
jgi:hypothetical protein